MADYYFIARIDAKPFQVILMSNKPDPNVTVKVLVSLVPT